MTSPDNVPPTVAAIVPEAVVVVESVSVLVKLIAREPAAGLQALVTPAIKNVPEVAVVGSHGVFT
ncbi:MAG: hypothetical protein ACYC96_00260 [Fimbriimonadaceae bacterium]